MCLCVTCITFLVQILYFSTWTKIYLIDTFLRGYETKKNYLKQQIWFLSCFLPIWGQNIIFFRSGFVKRQIYWQSCVICITVFLQITLFHVFMFFPKLTPYNGNYFKGNCHNVSGYKIQKKHFCLKNLYFL